MHIQPYVVLELDGLLSKKKTKRKHTCKFEFSRCHVNLNPYTLAQLTFINVAVSMHIQILSGWGGEDLNIEPSICIFFYVDAKQPSVQRRLYEKVPCSCAPQHLMNNGLCFRSVGKDGGRNRKRRLERMYRGGGRWEL